MTGAPDPPAAVEPHGRCYVCGEKTNCIVAWGLRWEYLCPPCGNSLRIDDLLEVS